MITKIGSKKLTQKNVKPWRDLTYIRYTEHL